MVKLSTRGDYGVRVVLELARAGRGAQLPAAELADRCKVPQEYVGHLLLDLKAHGIGESMRGPQGRFPLGRAGAELVRSEYTWQSVAEGFEAVYDDVMGLARVTPHDPATVRRGAR